MADLRAEIERLTANAGTATAALAEADQVAAERARALETLAQQHATAVGRAHRAARGRPSRSVTSSGSPSTTRSVVPRRSNPSVAPSPRSATAPGRRSSTSPPRPRTTCGRPWPSATRRGRRSSTSPPPRTATKPTSSRGSPSWRRSLERAQDEVAGLQANLSLARDETATRDADLTRLRDEQAALEAALRAEPGGGRRPATAISPGSPTSSKHSKRRCARRASERRPGTARSRGSTEQQRRARGIAPGRDELRPATGREELAALAQRAEDAEAARQAVEAQAAAYHQAAQAQVDRLGDRILELEQMVRTHEVPGPPGRARGARGRRRPRPGSTGTRARSAGSARPRRTAEQRSAPGAALRALGRQHRRRRVPPPPPGGPLRPRRREPAPFHPLSGKPTRDRVIAPGVATSGYRRPMAGRLPGGTVTFLFTDIEDSTRRWEEDPSDMADTLRVHDTIVRGSIEEHGGYVFATAGRTIRR